MTNFAITLEKAGIENTRAVIIAQTETGKYVENVFEADPENLDAMWSLIADQYPSLTNVLVDGEFVEADCLTVREAAEAAFVA